MTHGMPSKKGYVVFGVAGCVEVLRSCKDRINRRTGQDFESEMSDIEMFHAILCGGFCRCKKNWTGLALFSCRWALKADIVALLPRSLFFLSNAGGGTIERGTGHD